MPPTFAKVGTWLAFRPFEEPAKLVPILVRPARRVWLHKELAQSFCCMQERTHSKLLCMNKEAGLSLPSLLMSHMLQ